MNTNELRKKYLDFFTEKNHTVITSASLIPENDPTVLFTTAGMHPLVPYLMGEKHPAGSRLTDAQKCVRTGDIDEGGDAWHLTFFEMLGNWSLGDPEKPDGLGASYWKKEAISWSFEFLTKELKIPVEKLAVTCFAGDGDAPIDNESAEIWRKLGISENRIAYLGKADNWWGPAGQTGPCGPDTEMFYWIGEDDAPEIYETSDKRWVEIWNDVFMGYFKDKDGNYKKADRRNVDTGMGLERVIAVLGGMPDVYHVDTMWPVIEKIVSLGSFGNGLHPEYFKDPVLLKSVRIIADHLRAAVMIMGDNLGIAPSNVDQGYVVRKLIRRSIRHGRVLSIENNFCSDIAGIIVDIFKEVYPEIKKNKDFVLDEIEKEEYEFRKKMEMGLKIFDKKHPIFLEEYKEGEPIPEITKKDRDDFTISGKEAFDLYQTHGFPLELTIEEAKKRNLSVDEKEFEQEMKKHQELSRQGAEQKFKGGLADASEQTKKLHTATHLLQAALRKVLGTHVEQKGSNITAERLRFDFSYSDKMTEEQKKQVEDLVNAAIAKDYPILCQEMTVEEAKAKGAMGLFEHKYGERVKVYTVGDLNSKPKADPSSSTFSMEICGGPHVGHTGELGHFSIKKEEASSAGVRRIKAILE